MTKAELPDELDHYRQRVRELERALAEQNRWEAEYRAEVSRLARAFRAASIRAWQWSAETRLTQYLPIRGDVQDARGRPANEAPFAEERLLSAVHSDDREALADIWERANREHEPYDIEYRVLHGNGATLYQFEIGIPEFDESGLYLGHFGTTQDITERKSAEEKLRKSEERFRDMASNVPGLVYQFKIDAGGVMSFPYVSPTIEDIIGLKPADITEDPDTWLGIVYRDDRSSLDASIEESHRTLNPWLWEGRMVRTSGEIGWFRGTSTPRELADGSVLWTGLVLDITEQKEIEEQLRQAQRMEAIGQLTGGVAHDFNNLLAVIMGNTELLEERLGSEEKPLQAILRAATRGAELTQRLLAFSRRQPLQPQTVALDDLVEEMGEMLRRTLGETIEVEITSEPDLWHALVDPGQLENATLNLALNARDAMPKGGKLTIEIANAVLADGISSSQMELSPGDYVMVSVSDGGTGMTQEVLARAVEPFFTTKEVGEGSGLGLPMVYGFAKQSGGDLAIYSEGGLGTTVKLYLPRAVDADVRGGQEVVAAAPRGKGETVLVVEDDADVRELAKSVLVGLGYTVLDEADANTGLAALEAASQVDLLLSDVVLSGGMSGPDLAQEAMRRDPDLKVLFMSGYAESMVHHHTPLPENASLLNKPFHRHELAQAVRAVLDR